MFEFLIEFVKQYVEKTEILEIDTIENYDEKKLEITLNCSKDKMASIELLPNGTCDMMCIEAKTLNLISTVTIECESKEQLQEAVTNYLNELMTLG